MDIGLYCDTNNKWGQVKDLEKTMPDSSCGYEINNETHTYAHTPHKVLQATKGFFPVQVQKGPSETKSKVKMSALFKDEHLAVHSPARRVIPSSA